MLDFVNVTSPLSVWPRTFSVTSVASKRRYGPSGSTSSVSTPPTSNFWSTAVDVVLICRCSVPASETPGRLTATVPVKSAASPPVTRSRLPAPFVSETIGVPPALSANETLLAPTRTTAAPVSSVVFSNAKLPVSEPRPASVSVTPVASKRK